MPEYFSKASNIPELFYDYIKFIFSLLSKDVVISPFFRQSFYCTLLVVVLVTCVTVPTPLQAAPAGATANLRYEKIDNDGDKSWQFDQNYNLTFTKELSSSLEFSSSVRYSRDSASDNNNGSRINPSMTLDLRNDIFSLLLGSSFNQIKEDSEPTDDSWSWNANWMSQWDEVWPALRFNYDESYRTDDASPSQTDSSSRQFGAGINYEWHFFEGYYDFNYTKATDDVRNTSAEGKRHSANVNLNENWDFWDQFLSLSVGQRVSYNFSQDDVTVGAGNDYFIRDYRVRAFYAIDNQPAEGELPVNLALTDGNIQDSAGIDIANPTELHNLGFWPDTFAVNRVLIYFTDELTLVQQQLLVWEFYVSDDGYEWHRSPIAPFVRYEYDPLNFLTTAVVDLPFYVERRKYGKLLVSTSAQLANSVSISELEAGERRIATSDTVSTDSTFVNSESRVSLTIQPLDDWSINSSVLYRYSDNDPGVVSKEIYASLFSDYYWNRYFSFTIGVTENRNESEDVADEINRSYSLSITSSPLDTFDATLSFMKSEQYEDGSLTDDTNSISAYFSAQLYPDVTASLTVNWDDGEDSEITWRFDSTLRLTERMSLDIYCDDGTLYGGTYNYHPSDILAFTLGADRDDDAQSTILNSTVSWITSDTVRTSLSYYFDDAPERTNNGLQSSLTWDPSPLFTLQHDISYQVSRGGDDNRDSLYWSISLNMRW